jgi:hypothetical protein
VTLVAHAITAVPPALEVGTGLRGRALAWTEIKGLGRWSTEWDPAAKLERADALEHHTLIERICAAQPCLPVRFGTSFGSLEEAAAALTARAADLRSALERVAGRTELAVTLLWRDPGERPAAEIGQNVGTGRRYLEDRRERYAAADARRARATELVDRFVAELGVERALVWHDICTSEGVAVSLAVLVSSEHALERKAELERIAGSFDDVIGVVNGPWPPYSFTRLE